MGVPARGLCAAGHLVEVVATVGRVTWEGRCPEPGCGAYVKCRRVPVAERFLVAAPVATVAPSSVA